jgi:acetylglutamate kinase
MKLVIKFAGALLEDKATVQSLAEQIALLGGRGHEILVVHGGERFDAMPLQRLGIESKFVSGLRVTDRETRDVAVMVFAGLLNNSPLRSHLPVPPQWEFPRRMRNASPPSRWCTTISRATSVMWAT